MLRLFLLLFISSLSAQNYRFVYEYKTMPDITRKDSLITDYMNLDSDGKKSYFYNTAKYETDSAYAVDKKMETLIRGKKYDRNLRYVIEKDYVGQSSSFYIKFVNLNIVIPETEKPKWKLENEYRKINDLNCQKAIANYKGRIWEAWFAPYPITDGPYKFDGLPGLIVKLHDIKKEHSFDLIQIKKINSIFSLLPRNNKKMTKEEYQKAINGHVVNFANDAESTIANVKAGTIAVRMKDGYMAQFNYNDLKKNTKSGETINEEIDRRLNKRNSNPIELDHKDKN